MVLYLYLKIFLLISVILMSKTNLRTPRTFGQRTNSKIELRPKKKYFIVGEGNKTEVDYFNGIFNHRKELNIDELIDIIVVERDEDSISHSHPKHLLNSALTKFNKVPVPEGYETIEYDNNIDEIWLLFDRDPCNFSKEQFDEIYNTCNQNNIKIGFTNPTFEFWLLLHCTDVSQYDQNTLLENRKINNKRRFLEGELSKILDGYKKKNIRFERFKDKIDYAILQEKNYTQQFPQMFDSLGSNIGTLLEKMKSDI